MRKIIAFSFILSIFSINPVISADLVFDDNNNPIAIIGFEKAPKPNDRCSAHTNSYVVDEIAYDGVSEIVGGIRVVPVSKPKQPPKLMWMNTKSLSNYEMSWLPTLVQKGNVVRIIYNVCGNGGFHIVRNIYLTSKPK